MSFDSPRLEAHLVTTRDEVFNVHRMYWRHSHFGANLVKQARSTERMARSLMLIGITAILAAMLCIWVKQPPLIATGIVITSAALVGSLAWFKSISRDEALEVIERANLATLPDDGHEQHESTLTLDEAGLNEITPECALTFFWSAITEAYDTPCGLLIVNAHNSAFLLDREPLGDAYDTWRDAAAAYLAMYDVEIVDRTND